LKGKKKKSKESTDHERKWEQVAAARVLDPFLIPTYMPLAAVATLSKSPSTTARNPDTAPHLCSRPERMGWTRVEEAKPFL